MSASIRGVHDPLVVFKFDVMPCGAVNLVNE
jgi:hypothetical protein